MEIILVVKYISITKFLNNKEKYYKNWLIEINSSRTLILDYQINNKSKNNNAGFLQLHP